MKSISFFFPYYELSGCPVLFLNMAEYISEHHPDYQVSVIDYADGYMAQNRKDSTKVGLIPFKTGEECSVETDYLVIQAILPSAMRPELKIASHVKVFNWVLHPMNFYPSVFPLNFVRGYLENHLDTYRKLLKTFYPNELMRTREYLSLMYQGSSLCFNSSSYVPTTEVILGDKINEFVLLQNASSDSEVRKESFEIEDILHLSWVGRLCDFKIFILNYAMSKVKEYAESHKRKIVFHVIGDGEMEDLLYNQESEWFSINKEGTISKNDLDTFLVQKTDLNFAMGVSAIESAKLGIATVILDASYQEIKGDYIFHWFHTNEGFDTGHMITESDFKEGNNSLELIMDEFIANPKRFSEESYNYYEDNYSLKLVVGKLLEGLEKITITWGDLPSSVKKKSLSRKAYNYLKYHIA